MGHWPCLPTKLIIIYYRSFSTKNNWIWFIFIHKRRCMYVGLHGCCCYLRDIAYARLSCAKEIFGLCISCRKKTVTRFLNDGFKFSFSHQFLEVQIKYIFSNQIEGNYPSFVFICICVCVVPCVLSNLFFNFETNHFINHKHNYISQNFYFDNLQNLISWIWNHKQNYKLQIWIFDFDYFFHEIIM